MRDVAPQDSLRKYRSYFFPSVYLREEFLGLLGGIQSLVSKCGAYSSLGVEFQLTRFTGVGTPNFKRLLSIFTKLP